MTVAELLSRPENWLKECLARDSKGVPVEPESESATSWCLLGAIIRVYGRTSRQEIVRNYVAEQLAERGIAGGFITTFNNHKDTTHEKVLSLCRELKI